MTDKAEKKPGRGQAPWRKRAYATHSVHEAVTKLFISLGGADQARLVELWRHWEMVMGEMLAPLGRPLGHKDATLFIGAEDAMAMQEL
ncbi:DUF721 domain-containing protein, partial [Desulfovibrio sp. OttesenSCG-928-M16]|nr:DUF721 domain-containing protein [Desulfovibrio sp. OttesenSCG-928-M16]